MNASTCSTSAPYLVAAAMTESSPTEQTNALLAAVVASSMDAVFSIDTNARIQTWNSAAEQLYGYMAAEAIGQSLKLLAPDPTNYAPVERFLRVLQGEQIYFETSRRRKDGSLVEVGISSGPIRDPSGNVVGVSVVHRDISERKRSERDLHEIHQWLEMAQEAGDVAPWAYDSETGEVRWTKQLYRQLGYAPGEVTPSLSTFRERVHPDNQVRLADIREKEKKAEPGTQLQVELRLLRPNASSSWIERRSRVVEHQGRRHITGVNVDITQRKKQEDNLRFIMDELSHRTKNLLSVVQAMASQTARYSESYSDFEERFLGRIRALSQSHDLLVSQNWSGAAPGVDLRAIDAIRGGSGADPDHGTFDFLASSSSPIIGNNSARACDQRLEIWGALGTGRENHDPVGLRPEVGSPQLARKGRPCGEVPNPFWVRSNHPRADGRRHVRRDRQARAVADRSTLERFHSPIAHRQAGSLSSAVTSRDRHPVGPRKNRA